MRLTRSLILLLLICVVSQAGCRFRSLPEMLWPDQHDSYFQLTEAWSRSGVVRHGLESETRVVALLKSEEWRRGYVQRYAETFALTDAEAEKMLADQLRAAGEETEFVLAVASTYPEDARLTHRLTQWRILLLENSDQTVSPLEIRPMETHRSKLEAFYPEYHPWQRYYTVRFPKKDRPLVMVFTGPKGQTQLTWPEWI
ncbi:hypothetical protein SAMN05660653_00681 [Desulfonatronum thiosulfatophilum]|uniref:Uncharacterized protein n=1 Tax=Desulfonatronum thiosulfatophilum TaxID=617002 RepID=A0A1G6AZY1_9BACT|nr:hypothetical protein [Desulfonatronum thiosulfatophilum]SDB13809.1 hypothetical protein SAMN05660653_00681 [Desulfonatronum thiosulfatophilum]